MKVTLIAAMGRQRVIGATGGMPWHLPSEMRHFVRTTRGHPIIVGRKTFGSWGAKALPRRKNIVVTTRSDYAAPEGVHVASSLTSALDLAEGAEEVFICGGAVVYSAFMARADQMILTHIEASFEGDTWFPAWDPSEWSVTRSETYEVDADNAYAYTIRWYVRNITPNPSTELA